MPNNTGRNIGLQLLNGNGRLICVPHVDGNSGHVRMDTFLVATVDITLCNHGGKPDTSAWQNWMADLTFCTYTAD